MSIDIPTLGDPACPLGPGVVVDAPKASAPLNSITSVALDLSGTAPPYWEMGFRFFPETFLNISAWNPIQAGRGAKSTPQTNPAVVDYWPYYLETPFECSDMGFEANDYVGRALRGMEAATPEGLEHELWNGTIQPYNPNLKANCGSGALTEFSGLINGGAACSPKLALALLNTAIAECGPGSRGVIHAPVEVATTWAMNYWLVEDKAGRLMTRPKGNLVIAGGGYDGTGPAGATTPTSLQYYAFATTGPLVMRLGPPEVYPETMGEALDRATGNVVYRAERVASVTWDTVGCFGALVDITL